MLGSMRVWALEKVLGIVTLNVECSLYFSPLQLAGEGPGVRSIAKQAGGPLQIHGFGLCLCLQLDAFLLRFNGAQLACINKKKGTFAVGETRFFAALQRTYIGHKPLLLRHLQAGLLPRNILLPDFCIHEHLLGGLLQLDLLKF